MTVKILGSLGLMIALVLAAQGCYSDSNKTGSDTDNDADSDSDSDADTDSDVDTDADSDVDTDSDSDTDTDTDTSCSDDFDCEKGKEWCAKQECVPCDNSGKKCDLACPKDWEFYRRNGCLPCECAPLSDCFKDEDCPNPCEKCYAGAFCLDWCPKGDPSCCYGNICSAKGCPDSIPVGCWRIGCPKGETCTDKGSNTPSDCYCSDSYWSCTDDKLGGICA